MPEQRVTTEALEQRVYDEDMGRAFIAIGIALVLLGLLLTLGERLPVRLGRLPGDVVIRGKNTTFYFPLVTSLLLSALLSFVIWLLGRR
ncbi:MAG: DUF2905 domain-containing protein [Acidobacteriota bacterium]|nr:DUF2905 domain-containing protein [Acidobacteriota bacterium]